MRLAKTCIALLGLASLARLAIRRKNRLKCPSTVTVTYRGMVDGVEGWCTRSKKVKYIFDYAFTTTANGTIPDVTYTYSDGSTKNIVAYEYRRNYYNEYLKQVTFANNSNVEQIGMGAFQGCVNL